MYVANTRGLKFKLLTIPYFAQSLSDSIESSSGDDSHQVNVHTATPSTSHIITRGFPVSMATLYSEDKQPPDYMAIETPPSSPQTPIALPDAHISRTKATDWIKHVSIESNQSDQSHLGDSVKTSVDSGKRGRGKRFVCGGLAERMQRIIQRENSEITFWEHRSTRQLEDQHPGTLSIE